MTPSSQPGPEPITATAAMWHAEHGQGHPLVLLHPAPVDSRAFGPSLAGLAEHFHVYTPDRRGHGRTPDVPGPISYDLMAADTVEFLETVVAGPAALLGYSDGAVVALLAALRRPDLVRRLVLAAGVFHRNGWVEGVLDNDEAVPEFMRDSYAEVSPDGRDHFDVVMAKIAAEHTHQPSLTPTDLNALTVRTLVMIGDDDEVRFEHAAEMYRSIPDAELAVVPGTSHGLLAEKPDLCNRIIVEFLTTEPVATFAPIHRRAPTIS